jgi:hypothetical protein
MRDDEPGTRTVMSIAGADGSTGVIPLVFLQSSGKL